MGTGRMYTAVSAGGVTRGSGKRFWNSALYEQTDYYPKKRHKKSPNLKQVWRVSVKSFRA
jgi:hypothetical protein